MERVSTRKCNIRGADSKVTTNGEVVRENMVGKLKTEAELNPENMMDQTTPDDGVGI